MAMFILREIGRITDAISLRDLV